MTTFTGIDERWLENPKWRCENGHVSDWYVKSEALGGAVCPACLSFVKLVQREEDLIEVPDEKDDLDDEIWGPAPTPEEAVRAVWRNDARLAVHEAMDKLLGPGMTKEGKDLWYTSPNPFLDGRRPADVMKEGYEEVFDAIEQQQGGDFT